MQAKHYMSKPFIVTGHEVTEDTMADIAQWCGGSVETEERTGVPFVLVPVDRIQHKNSCKAYIGNIVTASYHRDKTSYKVYTQEYIYSMFTDIEIPPDIEQTQIYHLLRALPASFRPTVPTPRSTPTPGIMPARKAS